jgi:hypothetical protein
VFPILLARPSIAATSAKEQTQRFSDQELEHHIFHFSEWWGLNSPPCVASQATALAVISSNIGLDAEICE